MLRCIYAHLVLEVGQGNLDNSFHISYISIENFWIFVISYLKVSDFYLHISALSLTPYSAQMNLVIKVNIRKQNY